MEELDLELSNIFDDAVEIEQEVDLEPTIPEFKDGNTTLNDTLSETFNELPVDDSETFSDIFDQMFEDAEEVPKQNLGSTVVKR